VCDLFYSKNNESQSVRGQDVGAGGLIAEIGEVPRTNSTQKTPE